MKKNKKVIELVEQFPLNYGDVLYCCIYNKYDIELTRKELQEYVVKGH